MAPSPYASNPGWYVVTVPAYFDDSQRCATETACFDGAHFRQHVYVTPKHYKRYLSFLNGYKDLYSMKLRSVRQKTPRKSTPSNTMHFTKDQKSDHKSVHNHKSLKLGILVHNYTCTRYSSVCSVHTLVIVFRNPS